MFPVFLDLTGRLVVVIGGGSVGRRKASAVYRAGALVRLVALESRPPEIEPGIEWRQEPYDPRHLEGASLVFASASQEVNARVTADARGLGVWVSSASDPEAGDFITPATVQRGKLVLAVSTSGAAPALARRIREHLETEFDGAYTFWTDLLAEFRGVVHASGADSATRRALLEELADGRWLEMVRREGVESTRQAARAWLAERGIPGTL